MNDQYLCFSGCTGLPLVHAYQHSHSCRLLESLGQQERCELLWDQITQHKWPCAVMIIRSWTCGMQSGYPRPPRDLPPSPPPAARVCTAGQPSQPVVAGGSTQETHTSLASKSKSHVSHRETTFALKPTQLEPHSPAKTPASTSSDNSQVCLVFCSAV